MEIDLSKLENVKHLSGGKTTARCSACAQAGGDMKGEHLVVFPNGKFGCVANPNDKEHNKVILKLVGTKRHGASSSSCRLTIQPLLVEESRVLMKVGRLGRAKPIPMQTDDALEPQGSALLNPPEVENTCPKSLSRPPTLPVVVLADLGSCSHVTKPALRESLALTA